MKGLARAVEGDAEKVKYLVKQAHESFLGAWLEGQGASSAMLRHRLALLACYTDLLDCTHAMAGAVSVELLLERWSARALDVREDSIEAWLDLLFRRRVLSAAVLSSLMAVREQKRRRGVCGPLHQPTLLVWHVHAVCLHGGWGRVMLRVPRCRCWRRATRPGC